MWFLPSPPPCQCSDISQLFVLVLGYFYPLCWLWDGFFQSVLSCPSGNFLKSVLRMIHLSVLLSLYFLPLFEYWISASHIYLLFFFILWWAGFPQHWQPTELIISASPCPIYIYIYINWLIHWRFSYVYITHSGDTQNFPYHSQSSPPSSQQISLPLYSSLALSGKERSQWQSREEMGPISPHPWLNADGFYLR